MRYLALNAKKLKQLSHHRLWGLGTNRRESGTLYDAAVELQTNQELRTAIEQQIVDMYQRHWLIHMVCWLFNWNQYRLHHYQLQAYWSWQLYQRGSAMFSGEERLGIEAKGAFWVAGSVVGLLFLSNRVWPIAARSLTWFSNHMAAYLSDYKIIDGILNVEEAPSDTMTGEILADVSSIVVLDSVRSRPSITMPPIVSTGFTVRVGFGLVEALAILGLPKNINDFVTIDAIKEAYRESCKRTHPDKTLRDTTAEFQAVSKAYKDITAFVEHKAGTSSEDDSDILGNRGDIFAQMVAFEKKLDELLLSLRKLREHNQRQIVEVERQRGEIRALSERLSIIEAELDREEIEAGGHALTQEDRDGYRADPDYFIKQALMARGVDMSTLSTEDQARLRMECARSLTLQAQEDSDGYSADPDYFIKQALMERGVDMSTLSAEGQARLRMECARPLTLKEESDTAVATAEPVCIDKKPQCEAASTRRRSFPRFFSEGICSDGVEKWTPSVRQRSLTI